MAIYKLLDISSTLPIKNKFGAKVANGVPILTIKDMDNLNNLSGKFIDKNEFSQIINYGFLEKGDILVGRVGTIGKSIILDELSFYPSDNFILIRANKNFVFPKYLHFFIKKNFTYIKTLNRGSTQPLITKTDLMNMSIDLPNLSTQTNIINIIEPFEKILNNFIEKISSLKEYIKNNYLLNKSNNFIKILDLCNLYSQKYNNQQFYSDTSIVTDSMIDMTKLELIDIRKSRANLTPKNKSIVFSKLKGSNKVLPIYNSIYNNIVFSTGFFNISSKYNLFLYGYLLSEEFLKEKKVNSVGTLMEGLSVETLKNIKFKKPNNNYIDNENVLELLSFYILIINKIKEMIAKIIQILI